MPSAYNRNSLEDDIYQHTINNCDWSNRELLEALGLLTCSQAQLFKFLAEAVHPVVVDEPRQEMLVDGHKRGAPPRRLHSCAAQQDIRQYSLCRAAPRIGRAFRR